jgi:hypothetical protein
MTDRSPKALHEALDLLLAQYLIAHPKAMPSKTNVLQLMQWNHGRIQGEPINQPLAAEPSIKDLDELIQEAARLLRAAPLKEDVEDLVSAKSRNAFKQAVAAWLAHPLVQPEPDEPTIDEELASLAVFRAAARKAGFKA